MFGLKKKPHLTDSAAIEQALDRRLELAGAFPNRESVIRTLAAAPCKVYLGIDPTGPDIHLGHAIPVLFLKSLWDLGHTPVIVIGDFTARIGDPTGKSTARRPLSPEEISENEKHYISQLEKFLPEGSFEVKHNGDWLGKLSFGDVLKLAAQTTVQQMIQRDMFQERLNRNQPIGLHEFLYPLMQGYDSVAMEIDGEVGGNDQTFNMLVGRDLEKKLIGKDKMVFATRLLVDSASGKKMSKSEGEMIAVSDSPQEIRRKILAMSDAMIRTVAELCTEKPYSWIDEPREPRAFKEALADELVRMFHGEAAVTKAREPKASAAAGQAIADWLAETLALSKTESKRLLDQAAVKVNGQTEKDWSYAVKSGDKIQVGKGQLFEVK